jgi:hypothetical protein
MLDSMDTGWGERRFNLCPVFGDLFGPIYFISRRSEIRVIDSLF